MILKISALALPIILLITSCIPHQSKNSYGGLPSNAKSESEIAKLLETSKIPVNTQATEKIPLLSILQKYSKEGYYLIKLSETLKGTIKIGSTVLAFEEGPGKRTTTDSTGKTKEVDLPRKGFYKWIDESKSFIDQINDIPTAVHEENHSLNSRYAYFIFSKKVSQAMELMVPAGDGKTLFLLNFDSFYLSQDKMLFSPRRSVNFKNHLKTFPAHYLESFIPEDKRTFRYKTYISKATYQSTHVSGISGLLDEYNSYYWSCKVVYDLYDYYKNELPQTPNNWYKWTTSLFSYYFGWAEFRYWIISYMIYAKKNEPEIYNLMLKDQSLRQALTQIDNQYTDLMDKIWTRLTIELPEHLKNYNLQVFFRKSFSSVSMKTEYNYQIGNIISSTMDNYFLPLLDVMKTPEYVQAANAIRLSPQKELPKWDMDQFLKKEGK